MAAALAEGDSLTLYPDGSMATPIDVRRLRKKLGWSQEFLARQLGVSPGTVSKWETGKHQPSPAVYARLRELRRRANGTGKPQSIVLIAATRAKTETTNVQRIGGTSYKTKVFQAGQDSSATCPQPPGDHAEPPGKVQLGSREPPASPATPLGEIPIPHRADHSDPPKPKSNRRLIRILARVAIPILILILLPWLIIGAASAATGSRAALTPDLPQALSRMLPNLGAFVEGVLTDFTDIGQAYVERDYNARPGAGPDESLEKLLGAVSDLNQELGAPPDDQGIFNKTISFFRQVRQEAWSRATAPH